MITLSSAPIRTKLNPPQYLQTAMARPRLLKFGGSLGSYKLLSVSAPPGYGKSTYLSQLRQDLLRRKPKFLVPWLNLDSDDNDPVTMSEYLCAAFNQCNSKVAKRSLNILKSGAIRSLKEIYADLIKDLQQSKQPWTLFVDDFHVLEKGESLKLWQWFLDHLPENLKLIISSRKVLPLKLLRLQANQELLLIQAENLQFNHEEIRSFFLNYSEQQLSEEMLHLVKKKTEGWIGALQMLSLSLHQVSDAQAVVEHFSGEHQDIMEYLSEVVLEQLPHDLKKFMLNIAILDRFCVPVVAKLSGANSVQKKIEAIENQHLFLIPLDKERHWYRFHHLFQEFLRRQAMKVFGEEELQTKYREASLWFGQEDYNHEAIQYALAGKDYARAAELISQFAIQLVQNQGDHRTMLHWMKQLPEEYLVTFPMIRMGYIAALLFTQSFNKAKIQMQKLQQVLNEHTPDLIRDIITSNIQASECLFFVFQDQIALLRQKSKEWLQQWPLADNFLKGIIQIIYGVSHFYTSQFDEGYECFKKSASLLLDEKIYYAYGWALGCQGVIHLTHGRLRQALMIADDFLEKIQKFFNEEMSLVVFCKIIKSAICYESGDFGQSMELLKNSGVYIKTFSNTEPTIYYYSQQIRHCIVQQRFALVHDFLKEAECWAKEINFSSLTVHLLFYKVELSLQTQRIQEARLVLQDYGWSNPENLREEIEDTNAMLINIFSRLALSRVLMEENKFVEALERLESLVSLLEKIGLMRYLLSAKIQVMLCKDQLKCHDSALETLRDILELAAAEGFVSIFLENGLKFNQQLYALLKTIDPKKCTSHIEVSKLRNTILYHLENYFEQNYKNKDLALQLLDKISAREIEIISALDSAKTNAQIAKSFYISLGTLKWHLNKIYQKLEVKNRSGAIFKARQLGLL